MNVVSFFAGCGGLDLGFEQAGFHVVWANEFEPHCRATYIRNHPYTEFVLGDVCKIDADSIPDCDGFIGGPPCQSWSVGGRQRGIDDERGQLFLKYIELINRKKPKFFVIENVKGMLDEKFKDVFDDFINRLDCSEYDVQAIEHDTLSGYSLRRINQLKKPEFAMLPTIVESSYVQAALNSLDNVSEGDEMLIIAE